MGLCEVFSTVDYTVVAKVDKPPYALKKGLIYFDGPGSEMRPASVTHGDESNSSVAIALLDKNWAPLPNEEEIIILPGETVHFDKHKVVHHKSSE